jgi:hypothetical protein
MAPSDAAMPARWGRGRGGFLEPEQLPGNIGVEVSEVVSAKHNWHYTALLLVVVILVDMMVVAGGCDTGGWMVAGGGFWWL